MLKKGASSPVKLYYRIGEVAQLVGVQPHVLRYWESEFGSIRPQKSTKGQRVYSHKDLERLLRVKELLHKDGYTIAGARKKLREKASEVVSTKAEEASHLAAEQIYSKLVSLRIELQAELDATAHKG